MADTDPDRWNPVQWGFIAALKRRNRRIKLWKWRNAKQIHGIIGPKGRRCSNCDMVRKVAKFMLVFKTTYHTARMWCIEYKCSACNNNA